MTQGKHSDDSRLLIRGARSVETQLTVRPAPDHMGVVVVLAVVLPLG